MRKKRPERPRRKLRRNPLAPVVRKLGARVKPSARTYSRKGKGTLRPRRGEEPSES